MSVNEENIMKHSGVNKFSRSIRPTFINVAQSPVKVLSARPKIMKFSSVNFRIELFFGAFIAVYKACERNMGIGLIE